MYARASSIVVEDGNLEIVESYARTIRVMAEGEGKKPGLFARLKAGLTRSAQTLTQGITRVFTRKRLDQAALDELEELLIGADMGAKVAADVVAEIKRTKFNADVTEEEIKGYIAELRRLRAEAGRENEPFEIQVACTDVFDLDGMKRLAEAGVTDYITAPWMFAGVGPDEPVEAKADGIKRFADQFVAPFRS